MKTVTILVILIIAVAIAYTGYGILTFEPQKPAPLVFNEPSPDTLKSLGIYEEQSAEAVNVPLTPEQQQQTNQAMDKISDAMSIYQDYAEQAGPQLKTTLALLNSAIAAGRLPAYFLTVTNAQNPRRSFETITFNPANSLNVPPQVVPTADNGAGAPSGNIDGAAPAVKNTAPSMLACAVGPAGSTDILLGDDTSNNLGCTAADDVKSKDQVFLGGPGDDFISDSSGNRIINPGTGNDTIKLGPGRSILVLEDGWGHDTLTVDCTGVRVGTNEIPAGFPVPWIAKTTNFIVLSPRINAASVHWRGNTLESTNGDTLTINDNCFTLISASPE